MIHRAGAVHDVDVGIGKLGADERAQRVVGDHDCNRTGGGFIASANPRASLKVSGKRGDAFERAAATPLANTMPLTPIKIAGTPVARSGPISMANDL
jgi:hypothetical protein